MCLSKVTTTYDKPSDLIEDGWKDFDFGVKGGLKFQNFGGVVEQDKWLTATGGKITASDGRGYDAGFHIYSEQKWTRSYRWRVYYRRVTCIGDQNDKPCVVAQQMYVPSDPDGWPPASVSPASSPKKKKSTRWV